jgi:hypothetical protein
MLNDLFLTLFFFYLVGLTWGYLADSYITRHTRPITLFTIMLTVYSIHYLCNSPHTKKIQIVRPIPHTPDN